MTIKYYDTFSIVSRFTGYISDISIGDFYNNLSSKACDATAILGGLNSTAREGDSGSSSSNSSDNSSSSEGSSEDSSQQDSQQQSSQQETADSKEPENVVINPEDLTAGTSSVTGKRGSENIGLAVFDDDKFRGKLTAVESICHLLITNDIDSCIVSIDNPMDSSEKTELSLSPSKKSKISLNIKDNVPHISINISLSADILTLEEDVNYESNEVLEKISNSTEEYLEKEFNNYLKKVSKEYGTDIDNFGIKSLAHFATVQEWEEFNWLEKFKTAEFDVNVDVNVISSLLVTKT